MSLHPWGRTAALAIALAFVPAAAAGQGPRDARDAALRHVSQNAGALGVERADVAQLAVTSEYRSAHNGVTHVNVNQQHRGLEVLGAHATVNVAADGRVIFVGHDLERGLRGAGGAAGLGAQAAVRAAADALGLDEPTDLRVLSRGSGQAQRTRLSRAGISEAPIPARLGYQPTGDGLRLAWQLVIDDSSDAHLWNATVDAATGDLLQADDWTSHDNHEELEATLSRSAAAQSGAFSSPFPVNDGSSYRVFEFPNESANDGPRELVANPADGIASPFGWHDTDGSPGPEFTITRGNNVHAYLDQDRNNTPDFGDTDGGPGLDFDFEADLSGHAQNYRDAAVANLFYANNIVHDVLHQYGFDEQSGNFQVNNYGRGGGEGDYVRAEAADGNGTNNANFSTPAADGSPPRMQMYLWPGNQFGPQNQVVVDGTGTFGASWARFGPAPTDAGLPGRTLVYAGTGCEAGDYPDAGSGWIAVVDGGTDACGYLQRAETAEAAGADALIVAHNEEGNAPVLTGSLAGPPVGIPAVAVTQADGAAIRAAIDGDSATGSVRKHPDHPGIRDGDLENAIVLHEYGHGVSLRLTGGPGVNCLSGNEQAGEGWSDFLANTLLLNPALDDPQGPRGLVPWVLFQDSRQGNGLRPRPYSRTMEIQPFTYDSIKTGGWLNGASLSLPHGLGHGWAAVLWDMTWDLVDKHGFNPNIYEAWDTGGNNRALQYVIDGLKFQGCGPGLVVARDAIVAAADTLSEGEDTCTVWASFARRGLGYSAIQGTTNRNDNEEAFDTHPDCRRPFQAPIVDQPELNTVDAGDTQPVRFTAGGFGTADVLATNSPYSRLVDCETLRTVDAASPFITPRPFPVATETPGSARLTRSSSGVFQYPWKTAGEWVGTCRELVLTRADGVQHRAYFRFE